MTGATPPVDLAAARAALNGGLTEAQRAVLAQYPDDRPAPANDDEAAAEAERDAYIRLRAQRRAAARLAAEDAPTLRRWGIREFLDAPTPEPLVSGLLYADSLARIYGAPGCGKTFLALDLALHMTTGRAWCGRRTGVGPVIYVMAEGQRGNVIRARSWMTHHRVGPDELDRFHVEPGPVPLLADSLDAFCGWVREVGPSLVVLDTKNAMMIGDENSATDVGRMRAAMDRIRITAGEGREDGTGACVALIDHTGYQNTDRARGSSAGTGAMQTEILVTKRGGAVTATVTRDKDAPDDDVVREVLMLTPAGPSAALVPATDDEWIAATRDDGSAADERDSESWRVHPIPADLADGAKYVPELARLMAFHALGDSDDHGLTRAEALKAVGVKSDNSTGVRAWSHLVHVGALRPSSANVPGTKRGAHSWALGRNWTDGPDGA